MTKFIDCIDPGFGYENHDGYVRILDKARKEGGRLVMRHRWMWEYENGPIPEGMELDHKCKNRRCCNPKHLCLINRSDHARTTNLERYADIIELGCFLLEEGATKGQVSEVTGRSIAAINDWIREGKVRGFERKTTQK